MTLTFYVPMHTPGLPLKAQVAKARAELFHTSYPEYERRILEQMNTLFASSGFNAERDVRGIILNRWGHAYVVPEPGFFFDTPTRTRRPATLSNKVMAVLPSVIPNWRGSSTGARPRMKVEEPCSNCFEALFLSLLCFDMAA